MDKFILELVENSGNNSDTGNVSGYIETETEYDILGNVRTVTQEVGQTGQTATWAYDYDANENLTDTTQPEGNVEHREYDVRDQLTEIVQGYGVSGETTTVSFAYDGNRNRVSVTDGLSQTTTYDYDGYDRLTHTMNPVASETNISRDDCSNVTTIESVGTPDGRPPRRSRCGSPTSPTTNATADPDRHRGPAERTERRGPHRFGWIGQSPDGLRPTQPAPVRRPRQHAGS
jgi:YD repeat-containing protein